MQQHMKHCRRFEHTAGKVAESELGRQALMAANSSYDTHTAPLPQQPQVFPWKGQGGSLLPQPLGTYSRFVFMVERFPDSKDSLSSRRALQADGRIQQDTGQHGVYIQGAETHTQVSKVVRESFSD